MSDKKTVSDVEQILNAIAGGKQKITASDVLKGLTKEFKITMITDLPHPPDVVRVEAAAEILEGLGNITAAKVLRLVAKDYMETNASGHKNNRAKTILDALGSIFRLELEGDKAKKAFIK